jgi:hypothetical protein
MSKQSHPDFLIKLILRAQVMRSADDKADKGFIMVITTVLTVMMFSLLGAYLILTDMSKSATSAYVDSNNTFVVAESGLNMRANLIKDRFEGYARPAGNSPTGFPVNSPTTPGNRPTNAEIITAMQQCTGNVSANKGSGDFICTGNPSATTGNDARYNFKSDWKDVTDTRENGLSANNRVSKYTAYTFVADRTNYTGGQPGLIPLSPGEPYAGLNAQTYLYTVYASAVDHQSALGTTNTNTVLQMDFRSRVVPLFQFAAFYDGDLEINSSSNMIVNGRVHSNANLYVQPNTNSTSVATTFQGAISTAGGIYNRVDSASGYRWNSGVRFQLGGTGTVYNFPDYSSSRKNPLTPSEIASFAGNVRDGQAGAQVLTVPPAGFLRKRNYYQSSLASTTQQRQDAIGEYFSKADMRLEMVPDRDVTVTPTSFTSKWTRDERIIPFNFTGIHTGATGTCSTTPPTANNDPADNYIDTNRANATNLRCNIFTKGQLQSLRQPVLVLTAINQTDTTINHASTTINGSESRTLGKPTTLPTAPALTGTVTDATRTKVLRALQVAIASTPLPIALDRLGTPLNNSVYNTGNLQIFKDELNRLLSSIPTTELSASNVTTLMESSPNQIAALRAAWFLPAPIQRLTSNVDTTATRANMNARSSGFYDGRERRWITMLQTNLQSLSVWNRDGLYVEATNGPPTADSLSASPVDTNLSTIYQTNRARKNEAFNSGTGANFTNNLAFLRETTITNFATAPTTGSLQSLGLGSNDQTEGGLVFHTTVRDDLNGDGTSDVTATTPIHQKNPDGSTKYQKDVNGNFLLDGSGVKIPIILDRIRSYWSQPERTSSFGFAFNGGNYLPSPLNIVTDQAIYLQGDFNNNGGNNATAGISGDRLPASILADTITILSNQCITNSSATSATNHLGVAAGQIRCGLPRAATGAIDVTEGGNTANYYSVDANTVVNAAFLSYTNASVGNCRPNTSGGYDCGGSGAVFSGALNNYIRMLEDWNGDQFTYSGSFISLGSPLEYSRDYVSGRNGVGNGTGTAVDSYYGIPGRFFNFETKFNTVTGLPPLTPRAVYLQQQVFKRTF